MNQASGWYKWMSVVGGGLIWGAWAFYANSSVSLSAGVTAGLVQGCTSAFMTLIIFSLLQTYMGWFSTWKKKLAYAPLLTMMSTGSILVFAHSLAGTPEIIKTILPGGVAGCGFTFTTCLALLRQQQGMSDSS